MNDTTPLTADQIDELLSAELDGEFDAAARDLGLDPADARARLATEAPAVDARRGALAAARDALAEPPAIDELVAARVRAKAIKAAGVAHDDAQHSSRTHRLRRLAAVSGGLAAAIAVIAGLAVVLQGTDTSSKKNSTAAAPGANARSSTPEARRGATTSGDGQAVDLGTADDVAALVARARSHAFDYAAGAPAEAQSNKSVQKNADRLVLDSTCDSAARQVSGVALPTLRAVATLAGTPVHVYVFRKGPDEIVVVLRADCRLVNSQTVPATSG
jgi:hypothetical protein